MSQLAFTFEVPVALLSADDIYNSADQKVLSALREDRRIERKLTNIHARELGKYFSMWANTVPEGGLVVVGMKDKGGFAGCHALTEGQINELEKSFHTFCSDAKVDTKRVGVVTDDGAASFVILFRVHYREDKVVCDSTGDAYVRVGDEKHQLSHEESHELKVDKGQLDVEQEPVPLRFPDDFDLELVQQFTAGLRKIRQPLRAHTDEELLEHRHLGRRKDGRFIPNVACTLLFAKDPIALFPGCKVRFLRVEGEFERSGEYYNVVKDIPIEGPIPMLISQSAAIIASQLREFSRLGDDAKFYTASEYPKQAWFEALVNACVHRSYGLRNMNIFVKMFDDKLVIESPGGFPPFVTPENIYVTHHPRNPHLMNAMFYLDLVKEHAEGTKRMRDSMADMKLPAPEFQQTTSGVGYAAVKVTLRNNVKQRKFWVDSDVSALLGEALTHSLSTDEKRVLNFVAEHGAINVSQCLRLISSLPKWHAAKAMLTRMVNRGLLKLVHSETVKRDPHSYYTLPETLRVPINAELSKS